MRNNENVHYLQKSRQFDGEQKVKIFQQSIKK